MIHTSKRTDDTLALTGAAGLAAREQVQKQPPTPIAEQRIPNSRKQSTAAAAELSVEDGEQAAASVSKKRRKLSFRRKATLEEDKETDETSQCGRNNNTVPIPVSSPPPYMDGTEQQDLEGVLLNQSSVGDQAINVQQQIEIEDHIQGASVQMVDPAHNHHSFLGIEDCNNGLLPIEQDGGSEGVSHSAEEVEDMEGGDAAHRTLNIGNEEYYSNLQQVAGARSGFRHLTPTKSKIPLLGTRTCTKSGGSEVATVLHNASAYMITTPDVRRERTVSNDCSVKQYAALASHSEFIAPMLPTSQQQYFNHSQLFVGGSASSPAFGMFHELSAVPFAHIPTVGRFGGQRESRCASFDVNECLADGPAFNNNSHRAANLQDM
ncbi:hypothetical protein FGO68_gene10701 [Halteria grandinella]|uniref:Uncharacterized protein n=1 Tax=Halteria grandinella TaxID=5974 RepID=A0A8J8NX26_HALGN|nr:hypothetical protein FGO68_gene10701 [Halteria grandinella]